MSAALLASLTIFSCAAVIGYTSISRAWAEESLRATDGSAAQLTFGASLVEIIVRNMGAIMLLYSGVITLGLMSIFGLGVLAAYVGATMAVGISNVGIWQMVRDTAMYAPIEFLGCIVAAGAGLYPLFVIVDRIFAREQRALTIGTYLSAVVTSLKVFACAAVLILVAACIEAVNIAVG